MNRAVVDYFRCPAHFVSFETQGDISLEEGFFRLGPDIICYGRYSAGVPRRQHMQDLPDMHKAVKSGTDRVFLPFDFCEIVDNLRYERYPTDARNSRGRITEGSAVSKLYYFVRPILPIYVRKHFQRFHLQGWNRIAFPQWPVDYTVELLMEYALMLALRKQPNEKLPFIWFWPDGAPSCAIMTHDVESAAGRNFCDELMAIDNSFGIKSAFQIVPELRYELNEEFLNGFRRSGFEVNVHDLNHDGSLFDDREEFLRRAEQINRYAKQFCAGGFRSGAMYRNQEWYGAFDFSYDMSVPTVAHLEPQKGGCCTVMPYFIGKVLELPLTTTEDYSLFHILGDFSINLWRDQIQLILQKHGLVSFITHPDYLIKRRARNAYLDLLGYLFRLRDEERLWITLPSEVDRWWRSRSKMTLVSKDGGWRIDGPDNDRARVAYASLQGDSLVYELQEPPRKIRRTPILAPQI